MYIELSKRKPTKDRVYHVYGIQNEGSEHEKFSRYEAKWESSEQLFADTHGDYLQNRQPNYWFDIDLYESSQDNLPF